MQDQPIPEHSSEAGCLIRVYWMFLGNAILFTLLAYLFLNRLRFPSFLDAGCLLVLVSLIAARYIDIRRFNGANGENSAPATMADWRKYTLLLVTGCVAVWLAIRILIPVLTK
ncbi:MAG: hypothetical protein KBI41_04340 [Kiritimatiellae bacterium]|jgi:hypothetical protein|nr:hypothetical protein [Kiritimatiellia bacterium]MDD2347542.1 hypothetical protein [Kiritimatiellia bacterium]MDD3583177.1 hypothetical protein [Kiritimatiellia bacterium]HHU15871.1 hypothetical protein [Lentisphaerota bacterium]